MRIVAKWHAGETATWTPVSHCPGMTGQENPEMTDRSVRCLLLVLRQEEGQRGQEERKILKGGHADSKLGPQPAVIKSNITFSSAVVQD